MRRLFILVITLSLLAACQASASDTANAIKFKLSSPAFADSGLIPKKFTCQGENVSPELNWREAPASTRSFALIMDDPDAPGGVFTHWLVWNIPPQTNSFAEGNGPTGTQGENDFGKSGYRGPCPPAGTHRYCQAQRGERGQR